jgi:hypothetical protein
MKLAGNGSDANGQDTLKAGRNQFPLQRSSFPWLLMAGLSSA